jgi:hypothetical protein
MYLDDLPVWGMVGIVVGTDEELQAMEAAHEHEHQVRDAFIYTSKKFTISHNSQQIIEGMYVCMYVHGGPVNIMSRVGAHYTIVVSFFWNSWMCFGTTAFVG